MELKNTPQFNSRVLIFHLLEYSRMELAEVSQHGEVLLILVTRRACVFPVSVDSLEEMPVSCRQKRAGIRAPPQPVGIPQILRENFPWCSQIGVAMLFSTSRRFRCRRL